MVTQRCEWGVADTNALLLLWADEEIQSRFSTSRRHGEVYELIVERLRDEHGIERDVKNVRIKLNNMIQAYRKYMEKPNGPISNNVHFQLVEKGLLRNKERKQRRKQKQNTPINYSYPPNTSLVAQSTLSTYQTNGIDHDNDQNSYYDDDDVDQEEEQQQFNTDDQKEEESENEASSLHKTSPSTMACNGMKVISNNHQQPSQIYKRFKKSDDCANSPTTTTLLTKAIEQLTSVATHLIDQDRYKAKQFDFYSELTKTINKQNILLEQILFRLNQYQQPPVNNTKQQDSEIEDEEDDE